MRAIAPAVARDTLNQQQPAHRLARVTAATGLRDELLVVVADDLLAEHGRDQPRALAQTGPGGWWLRTPGGWRSTRWLVERDAVAVWWISDARARGRARRLRRGVDMAPGRRGPARDLDLDLARPRRAGVRRDRARAGARRGQSVAALLVGMRSGGTRSLWLTDARSETLPCRSCGRSCRGCGTSAPARAGPPRYGAGRARPAAEPARGRAQPVGHLLLSPSEYRRDRRRTLLSTTTVRLG